jgi:hypothetical protein
VSPVASSWLSVLDTELDQFRAKQQTPQKMYRRESLPSASKEEESIDTMMKTLKEIKKTHKRKREEGPDLEFQQRVEEIDAWEFAVEEVEDEAETNLEETTPATTT